MKLMIITKSMRSGSVREVQMGSTHNVLSLQYKTAAMRKAVKAATYNAQPWAEGWWVRMYSRDCPKPLFYLPLILLLRERNKL